MGEPEIPVDKGSMQLGRLNVLQVSTRPYRDGEVSGSKVIRKLADSYCIVSAVPVVKAY